VLEGPDGSLLSKELEGRKDAEKELLKVFFVNISGFVQGDMLVA
jgi:hypothetical protein